MLDRGVVVFPYFYIGSDVEIGDQVILFLNNTINHNSVLEDFTIISSGANIPGGTLIGNSFYLGPGCSIRQKISMGPDFLIEPEITQIANAIMIYKNRVLNLV